MKGSVLVMKKRELILHIGSHKTGTTSLQNSLHVNKQFLESKGIYYGNYHEWKMHHNLAFGLFREALEEELITYPETHYYFSEIADKSSDVIERIKKEVELSQKYQKIIISSEGLFGPGNFFAFHSGIKLTEKQQKKINTYVIERLNNLLSDFDVKVICYLRRQDLILESFYNQYCKGPDPENTLPLPTFEEYCNTRPIVMDYYNEMSSWASYFGKENIIIRPYERKQLPLGVVYDFYTNILGFSDEDFKNLESIDAGEENSRINRDVLEYKRLLQINGLDSEFIKISNVLGDINKNQFFLDVNMRENVLNNCRESNKKIATEFLFRSDGQLFFDMEIKQTDVYEGLTLEKSIEISNKFINMFLNEKKQITKYSNDLILQIDNLNAFNNALIAERERLEQERDAALSERDTVTAEKESLKQERDTVAAERESLKQERDALTAERESLTQERDALIAERESLTQERDALTAERESLTQERDALIAEREKLKQERDTLGAELAEVYGSKSWIITKPLRLLGRMLR